MLKRQFILEIAGFVLLIVLTVLFALIILNKKTANIDNASRHNKQSELLRNDKSGTKIKLSEFVLQKSESDFDKGSPFFLRSKHKKWSLREVAKYWKNQGDILGKILEEENEKKIEVLLKE